MCPDPYAESPPLLPGVLPTRVTVVAPFARGLRPQAGWVRNNLTGLYEMCIVTAFLILTAILFGFGFALHALWWIALAAVALSLVGLAFRPRGRQRHLR